LFYFCRLQKTIASQIYFDCCTATAYLFVKISFHPVIFACRKIGARFCISMPAHLKKPGGFAGSS
jgi:hypothetical protein